MSAVLQISATSSVSCRSRLSQCNAISLIIT